MFLRAEELRDLAVRTRLGASAFERWAAQFRGCPSDPASLVFDVDALSDHFGILTTSWEGRRARWKSVPCSTRERIGHPPLIVEETIDPWTADERELRVRSDHIAVCDPCSGSGKVSCAPCSGIGKRVCATCRGERKRYGHAANGSYRLLNCTACRGRGEVDCAECHRGIATCSVCAGEKRVQRWIAIERWQRTSIAEYPPWIASWFGSKVEQQGEVVATVDRPRPLTRADLGGIAPEWLTHLSAGPAQAGERIARQELRMIRIPRLVVHYHLGDEDDTAEFSGSGLVPLQSNPPAPFAARARRLRAAAALLVTTGVVATTLYLGQGIFYWSRWSLGAIVALVAALALLHRAAAEHTGARRCTARWLGGAGVALVVMLLFGFAALPRATHVRTQIAAGKFADAERELKVLDDADGAAWADLRLARIRGEKDLAAARGELATIPRNLPQFTVAAAAVDRLVIEDAQQKLRMGDYAGVARSLELLHAGAPAGPVLDALRSEAEYRTSEATKTRDVEQRLRNSRIAEEAWSALDRAGQSAARAPLVAIRTAMARDIATLEARQRKQRGY